jgi:hypothetical protein
VWVGPFAKNGEGEGTAATVSIARRIEYQRKRSPQLSRGIAQPPPLNQSFKIGWCWTGSNSVILRKRITFAWT